MNQFSGSRRALSAAILLALTGTAAALDPQLDISGAPATIPLSEVRFTPGSKLLYARSLAGNFECGTASTPTAGKMQLDLDGRRYEIVESGNGTIGYAPTTGTFSIALTGVTSSNCISSGATVMDLVALGATGEPTARSRIGQAVHATLPSSTEPTVVVDMTLMDPIRCESYGLNPDGIDAMLTDANGSGTPLTGVARLEYRLAEVGGRRELRMHSELASSGVQRVQCTSPGLALGRSAAGAVPGQVFFSAFEPIESMADVNLSVGGGWITADGSTVRIPGDSDGARVELTIVNPSRTDAADVRVREYLRTPSDISVMRVVAGTDAITCTPLPADAAGNPCAALPASPSFPLGFDIPTLRAGEGLRLTLHRQLASGVAGQTVDVGYAAFVDPQPASLGAAADGVLGNNAKWVDFAVS